MVDCQKELQEVVEGQFQKLFFLLSEIDSIRNKEEMYQLLPLWGSRRWWNRWDAVRYFSKDKKNREKKLYCYIKMTEFYNYEIPCNDK